MKKDFTLSDWQTVWRNFDKITPITKTANDQKCLYKFIMTINKRITVCGPRFVSEYCQFQLAKVLNFEEKKTWSGKVTCPMIFGEEAVKQYWNRNPYGKWTNHHVKSQISEDIIKTWVKWPVDPEILVDNIYTKEVMETATHKKAQNITPENRVRFCLQLSTLYKSADESCQICSVSNECKIVKDKIYPMLKPKRTKGNKNDKENPLLSTKRRKMAS